MDAARPVVLVTGAARRIGAAIAAALHAAGYDVAVHCRRSRDDLDALAARLERARPGSTLALQADLEHVDAPAMLVDATLARFGRLDALVNNASTFAPTPLATLDAAQWDALFSSNARAPLFLAQAAAPALTRARGAIVNLLDIYAERPLPQHTVYCMAKAALAMMTLALARDLAPAVRVNGVAPGAVLWPEHGKPTTEQEGLLARTPLARTGTADEIADAVVWLVREASYTTGQILRVDGGRSLWI
jgi:pteridine reductase